MRQSASSPNRLDIANVTHAFKLALQDDLTPQENHSNHAAGSSSAHNGGPFSNHFDYISTILNHCGIHSATPISIARWYSPSHPLNPSIFHQLEQLSHPTATAERRLVFELVDELLAVILKPYMNPKPWVSSRTPDSSEMRGSELMRKLCERIGSIPAADCQVLEDIDGLIERDMGRSMQRVGSTALEEEAEEIVREIEHEIVETLVHEMAPAASDRLRSHVSFT